MPGEGLAQTPREKLETLPALPQVGFGTLGEEVLALDTEKITVLLNERLSILSKGAVSIANLFAAKAQSRVEGSRSRAYVWGRDNLLCLATLLLDGKTSSEIATLFNRVRPTGNLVDAATINGVVLEHFNPTITALANSGGVMRRQHEFLSPNDPEIKDKLAVLLTRARNLNLPADKIISAFDDEYMKRARGGKNRRRTSHKRSLYDPDVATALLYARFCEGRAAGEQRAIASLLLGRKVKMKDLNVFFSRGLTEEAKAAFGIKKRMEGKLTAEEFKTAAAMLIADTLIRSRDIAERLGRSTNDIPGKIRDKGRQLLLQERYRPYSPLVAFLLEYGEFPQGADKVSLARAVEAIYSNANLKRRMLKERRQRAKNHS